MAQFGSSCPRRGKARFRSKNVFLIDHLIFLYEKSFLAIMRFLLSSIAAGPSTAPSQSADLNLIEGTLQSDAFSKTPKEGMVFGGMVFHPSSSFPDT